MTSWIRHHIRLTEVIIVSIVLAGIGWSMLSYYQEREESKRLDKLLKYVQDDKNFPTGSSKVPEYEKNAYIEASPETIKRVGQRIRKIRKVQKLSQEKLAEKSKIHRTYMGKIERGESNPPVHTLEKVAGALKIPLSKLFE